MGILMDLMGFMQVWCRSEEFIGRISLELCLE